MALEASRRRVCGDSSIEAGRGPGQLAWYRYAQRFVANRSVLDVGAGLGLGTSILREVASSADGQDLDGNLAARGILTCDLSDLASKSYDVVVSIEVLEHVDDPYPFLQELARIARHGIFLTTPNWTASRCMWPFHVHEYTPREFYNLLAPLGEVELLKHASDGEVFYPVRHPEAYFALNQLRCHPATDLLTRCANHLLPVPARIHSHNAAHVRLA